MFSFDMNSTLQILNSKSGQILDSIMLDKKNLKTIIKYN